MKHFSAILVFILAIMLQAWFAPAGVRGDFVLATLVVIALLFTFWELAIFVLFGVFLLHASPYPDLAMLLLAGIPFAAYFIRRHFYLDPWFGAAVLIAASILLFYAVTAPLAALHAIPLLALDIVACVLFGELILYGIEG